MGPTCFDMDCSLADLDFLMLAEVWPDWVVARPP